MILMLGLSFAATSSAWAASATGGAFEEFITGEMAASGVPGLSYAAIEDGEITLLGARGFTRIGSAREVTPDTAFLTGSISKSFTALAVMQLVEADKVELDDAVSHYLDGFSGRPAGAITIRQLLSHTSGFSTLQGNASHSDSDSSSGKDELARGVERLENVIPAHKPGEQWEYSNTNYEVLGRLIEVVSGQEFQAYVAGNILEPVGMTHSFVSDGQIHEDMATGHSPWFGTKRPLPDNTTHRGTAPQGGVIASASDLARYLQMMMNGENDVLSAAGKALMMTPASEASPFYGFGWFLDSELGTVWHTGMSPGFETTATMIPAEKKAAVVLTNAGSGLGFGETTQLRNGITARILNLDYAGEGSRWSQKALFISLVLLPVIYIVSMIRAWLYRGKLRALLRPTPGRFGLFSLWFPLLTTLAAAWVILGLVPSAFGVPITTLSLFQPDVGLVLIASAVTGVLWAVFRLAVAYSGAPR